MAESISRKINAPFLFREDATPAEYSAGLKLAIERGCLWIARQRHSCEVRAGGAPICSLEIGTITFSSSSLERPTGQLLQQWGLLHGGVPMPNRELLERARMFEERAERATDPISRQHYREMAAHYRALS